MSSDKNTEDDEELQDYINRKEYNVGSGNDSPLIALLKLLPKDAVEKVLAEARRIRDKDTE